MSIDMEHVYIVDDDESVRRSLGFLLGTYGFLVKSFPSAEEFFGEVLNSAVGCLLLDIHMPGLDGWATLLRLNRSGFILPVIIISAEKNGGPVELRAKSIKAGAIGFLQKPFNDQELVGLIDQAFLKRKEN